MLIYFGKLGVIRKKTVFVIIAAKTDFNALGHWCSSLTQPTASFFPKYNTTKCSVLSKRCELG